MANSVNRVTLLGNLGRDPEIKTTPQGSTVANFSIATSESYKDKNSGEWKENTDWHRIVMWDNLAERVKNNLTKGTKVYVEGKLKTRSYEQNGETKYITEVLGQTLVVLSGGMQSGGGASNNSSGAGNNQANKFEDSANESSYTENDEFDDDVPF